MPPRYLQCQQPFWTRSTCTWWTPIRPIWISPFLDVSKSGYLKRNDVSLSLIFYPRKIPFLKRIFGDNVWLCPDTLVFQKPSFKIPRICQNYETRSRCIFYCTLISKYISCQVNSKRTIRKKIYHSSSFRDERRFDPLSKIFNPIERARGKKPAQELARISDGWKKMTAWISFGYFAGNAVTRRIHAARLKTSRSRRRRLRRRQRPRPGPPPRPER